MKLSLWLYGHRFGYDILTVMIPDNIKMNARAVIKLTGIDWKKDREDETLEHHADLELGILTLDQYGGLMKSGKVIAHPDANQDIK